MASELATIVPANVAVFFRAVGDGAPETYLIVTVNLRSLNLLAYGNTIGNPWTKTLHRYEIASYDGAGPPTNQSELEALANQLAADWYSWQLAPLDKHFSGIANWKLEGYHDVEWRQRDGIITTHVQRGPFNPSDDLLYRAVESIGDIVLGGDPNCVVYINNIGAVTTNTNFIFNDTTNLFSVVNNDVLIDIYNNKYFQVINSSTSLQYINITNATNTFNVYGGYLTINNSSCVFDLTIINQWYIWDEVNYYCKADYNTNLFTIWNNTVIINDGSVKIDILTGDQLFFIWDQTNYFFYADKPTGDVSIWNSTVIINNGYAYFNISTGDQIFVVWDGVNYFIKIDATTNIINIWNDTVIVNNGGVYIDIKIGDQLYYVWNETNYYINIDNSTQTVSFSDQSVYIQYSGVTNIVWLDIYGNVFLGKPGTTTSTFGFLYYWYAVGPPTGTPTNIQAGYVPLYLDLGSFTWWVYVDGAWKKLDGHGGTGCTVPCGTDCGDMLVWNAIDEKWVVLSAAGVPDGYVLTADSSSPYCVSWQKQCCDEDKSWYCLEAPEAYPVVDCCPNPVPTPLNLAVVCGDVVTTVTITYDSMSEEWVGSGTIGSCNANLFSLRCSGDAWVLVVSGDTYSATQFACDPVQISFANINLTVCGLGTGCAAVVYE